MLTGAVFLSYASGDGVAAERICASLRATGIEVWFDQSELRGGDAWDQSIRKQIKTCALFLAVISRNTHNRDEGYFRLEWKLAVDRCQLMAADKAFLLPVVIDDTPDDDERVPERFREVQWTRLPNGVTPAAFVERVRRLLSGEPSQGPIRAPAAPTTQKLRLASWRSKVALRRCGYCGRRAVVLDPLNGGSHETLGHALYYVHQYDEAIRELQSSLALNPDVPEVYVIRGRSYYALGNLQGAQSSCEIKPDYWSSRVCLAVTYDKLGRHVDAEKMLTKLKNSMGEADAYQYAQIYAQWGNTAKALEWLDTAMRLRDSGLVELKNDPLLDPLRKEPRFRAIEREVKFPT